MSLDEVAKSYASRAWQADSYLVPDSVEDFRAGKSNTVELIKEEIGPEITLQELESALEAHEFRTKGSEVESQLLVSYTKARNRKLAAVAFLGGESTTFSNAQAASRELTLLEERAINYMAQEGVGAASMFAIAVMEEKNFVN